ncbi:hypothetical protein KUG47_12950 [Falsochrobactrum sp. TDYN1]|uniref:Uncharacterized protein n=1 Tax=Falsochrobactrum tianjinense TaxID=2706015 RepID=A0A949UV19_9HYPH|nr:hypothetical protein [Falsochrobactrum sp. TDYN1]MBV2144402.1 hypothetical protein [Falsochrobactrum sp. TDYN1]
MIERFKQAMVSALEATLATSDKVQLPPGGILLWDWFMDLNSARTWHANGPNPISFSEISEYARLYRWSIQPHHIAVLRAMDAAYVEHFYAKRETGGQAAQKPAGELSADLFDAVFG